MFKFILIVGFSAFALFWIASPAVDSRSGGIPSEESGNLSQSPILASSHIEAIARRREIFYGMVSEVKAELLAGSTERERNLFDLAPSNLRWEVLRSRLVELGSPDGPVLASSLAIGSLDDIEFGTLDGTVACSIPDEVGFLVRQPSR